MDRVLSTRLSSHELVQACLKGDQEAWAELIHNYQRLIYSVARAVCPEPQDAADIFQQVCLELYNRLPDVRDVQSLPSWLITVTRRTGIAMLRKRLNSEDLERAEQSLDFQIEAIHHHYDLERALSRMPDPCTTLLVRLYFSEEPNSYESIARELGIPVSSVGPTRARCLQKLRKILEAE
jgi:RNA polymerase sigma factor (sigma-70 family)